MLKLEGIKKDYKVGDDYVHALRGINIEFQSGEFVSILGPSGCGKTTLMNIVGGLDRATEGELIISGKHTKDFTDREWDDYRNKKIGFIFQSYNLIPHLTVYENVEIALTISGVAVNEKKSRVLEALKNVGLLKEKNKKPNQLSGGQCQRVAIARALINDPEIILADEPTGALDTNTSEQIMEIISSISKTKLVLMVTHNPELAERYSTRLVKITDGLIVSDELKNTENEEKEKEGEKRETGKKSRMSFFTALKMSFKNLITKKGRTIMTSIAGSIGIIGIALILAISNGMQTYIDNLQKDMLSSTPISISTSTVDIEQAVNVLTAQDALAEFPQVEKVFVKKALDMSELMKKNILTQEYIDYIGKINPNYYSDIMYRTGLDMSFYTIREGDMSYAGMTKETATGSVSNSGFQMLPESEFVLSQYDILYGTYPQNKEDLVLVVTSTNEISESTLVNLGIRNVQSKLTEYDFSALIGKPYKILTNNLKYQFNSSKFDPIGLMDLSFDDALTLHITGILRIKEEAKGGALSSGIGYTKELYRYVQTENLHSDIVKYMNDNPENNPFTGVPFVDTLSSKKEEQREAVYRRIGGCALANEINIYPKSYETKDLIKDYLNAYNADKEKKDKITYSDTSELIGESITSIIDVITYVLIAFTAISLVVSSIMIAIITFVSVLERTKEIGVLRAIGARKKDVKGIFVAETFIIGLLSGVIGVVTTYVLSIPINVIMKNLVGVSGIAALNPLYAFLLILVSIALTVLSGLIPANKASKQDPVIALRTE